jgi:asparagine synthase (glutamine-hydrolysing)
MCGIAGIVDNIKSPQLVALKVMLSSLAHRGPDAEGVYVDSETALGHRRLSIIDLSSNANQPFYDICKRYVIVFNGEIYNYQELKAQIDYPWQSTSDTEVILAAYIKWGVSCLKHLNGMFAFSIYDTDKKELFVARDRMGVKPFYYYTSKDCFVFASEIRAIIKSGYLIADIDNYAINGYLSGLAIQTPHTAISGIKQLCPGEYGMYKQGVFKTERYWSIVPRMNSQPKNETLSYSDTVKKTRELLEQAIKSRMVADVNVGAFLSGGIDSSAIVALMSKFSDRPIDTFSIVFSDKKFDEREYAQLIANKYNTNHTELELDPKELIQNLDEYFKSMDSPTVDGINTWMVSKLVASTGIKVAVSGLGGDELFAGYPGFTRWKQISDNKHYLNSVPVRAGIAMANQFSHKRSLVKMNDFLNNSKAVFGSFYAINRANFLDKEIQQLLSNKNEQYNYPNWLNLNDLPKFKNAIYSEYSIAELSYYTLNVLLKDTDQMSMRWALEIREPFFDYKLVEFILTVPDQYKFDKNTPKKLLVDAMGDLLPKEVVYRPKKGFSFPWDSWIRNELKVYCEESLLQLAKTEMFDTIFIQQLWKRFLSNDSRVNWVQIWSLVVLQKWVEHNLKPKATDIPKNY